MHNNIFQFKHFLVYLGGAIQYASDGGVNWRRDVTNKMMTLGIPKDQIIDPCDKPLNNFEGEDLDMAFSRIGELRKQKKWKEIERLSRNTIRVDLRLVDKSDLIYVHIDPQIHTCGTYDEISVARTQKKPVIAVIDGGLENAPYWLMGRIGVEHIFATDDDALSYIGGVMKGQIAFDPKSWLFFDF